MIGKPNVGKSSLVNCLAGTKVSITSRRPQTTRSRILGIVNRPNFQLALVDTPGIHRPKGMLRQRIDRAARDSIITADVTVMVVDARGWRPEDDRVWKAAESASGPLFIVINKIDLLDRQNRLLPLINEISKKIGVMEIIPMSAKRKYNLDRFLRTIYAFLPVNQPGFEEEKATVANLDFSVAEIVREQVFHLAGAEIPYKTAVTAYTVPIRDGAKLNFHADIWVESAGQKAILVGAGGQRLKNIGMRARKEVESLLGTSTILTTRVKIRQGWSSDPAQLQIFGYGY